MFSLRLDSFHYSNQIISQLATFTFIKALKNNISFFHKKNDLFQCNPTFVIKNQIVIFLFTYHYSN